ncbi:LANO_0G11628g1_1 [Lachancea nothofagi CBS 11611]|uniref:Protein LOT5 n=1 Tax=Lachancea nothofagi CBS 11611 TaxID=1266666 RepID=A0A1G4KJQ8_9SACH|nr:LANO_0G11628g1_1 [Lachancea nothofagi CBS 11611]
MLKNANDSLFCQVETTKPTVENVTPFPLFQQTQPRLKGVSLDEQNELPILYGGGREFLLGLIPQPGEPLKPASVEVVDLFVLNTCLVIWLKSHDTGVQVPYQNIVYHGVHLIDDCETSAEGHTVEIVLTIQRDPILNQLFPPQAMTAPETLLDFTMSTVELVLRPRYADFDRVYNEELEDLFTFKLFGLNRGDTLVINCNNAIARCMDFHYVDEQSEEEAEEAESVAGTAEFTGLGEFLNDQTPVYHNIGAADDLDEDDGVVKDDADAGMSLEFYGNQQLAGRKKMWENDMGMDSYKKYKS